MQSAKQWLNRFDALMPRERLLLVLAATAIMYFVFNFALLSPETRKQKALQQQVASQKSQLAAITSALAQISNQMQQDPLAKEKAERDNLKRTVDEANAIVDEAGVSLPIGQLIRNVLNDTPGLTLVALKTLPSTVFFAPSAPQTSAVKQSGAGNTAVVQSVSIPPMPTIYKYGVEVGIKGRYLALIPYLENLQRSSKHLYWGDMKIDVATYPDATLRMTIYTLSENPNLPLG